MKTSDIIASIGVLILLIAFVLNLQKRLDANGRFYTGMNFFGAALCGLSSYLIEFYPFVVLETVWAAFAFRSLLKATKN